MKKEQLKELLEMHFDNEERLEKLTDGIAYFYSGSHRPIYEYHSIIDAIRVFDNEIYSELMYRIYDMPDGKNIIRHGKKEYELEKNNIDSFLDYIESLSLLDTTNDNETN